MEASSYEVSEGEIDEGSLNETANSVHFQTTEKDKEMASINKLLQRFIRQQLESGIKFDNIHENKLITSKLHKVIEPRPSIYCLPHTILFLKSDNLQGLKERFEDLQRGDYCFSYDREKKQLALKVHNSSQMCFYNFRTLKTDPNLHQNPCLLDSKYLVDKLYEFYQRFYSKIYFKETVVLILYWAHQRELLEHVISQQALKLVIICIFINFGYGVNNIVSIEAENPQKIDRWKKMYSYSRLNNRGETEIQQELITQFQDYTIQEKRGFFMMSTKRFMQIKDVIPISYPLLPLNEKEEEKYFAEIDSNLKGVIEHETENMSICKNIAKLFKFLYNKFDKQMRFVVDFSQKVAYRHEFSENFELEVLHPVLNTTVCKLRDSRIKYLRQQINSVYQSFTKNLDPIDIISKMLEKARP